MLDSYCWLPSRHDNIHEIIIVTDYRPSPVAARCKAWVCGRSIAGLAGSNPAGGMDACLCVGLVTSLEDSYRVKKKTENFY